MQYSKNKSWWVDSLFLTIVLGSLFFILLGVRPLFTPDEGRYAEIAREMVASGDYVTPYLNGIKYFEKPILFYWLASAAIKIGGLNLWAIRSISALLGLFGCLLTYWAGRQLFDRVTGLLAALILGTSLLYFVMDHMISLDLPVTVFLAGSLYSFILGSQEPADRKRRLYIWSAAAFAALAVLTKGLIGIVFPALVIGAWIALLNEWIILKRIYLFSTLLIFVLIAAPWHIVVGLYNPEFFYFYFIAQHFLRYATMDIGHYQPAWFFIPCLILGFFPWIVFLPQAITKLLPRSWKQRSDYKTELFFLLWFVIIFTFFSFSKSKLIPYILPIFPALAMITGRYLALALASQKKYVLGVRAGYICLILLAIIIAKTFYSFTHDAELPDVSHAKLYLYIAAIILCAGSGIACIMSFRNLKYALITTISTAWLFLLLIIAAIPSIDSRSILPLAKILKPVLQQQDDIITYNQYFQDLPFYLQRRITILNWRNEMSHGMQYQDTNDWMIDDATFWQRWDSKRRVYVIMSLNEYANLVRKYPQKKFHVLGKTTTNILIRN